MPEETAGPRLPILIRNHDPDDKVSRDCYSRYCSELAARFGIPLSDDWVTSVDSDEFRAPNGRLVIAWVNKQPVGCGAVRITGDIAEIKRMWVDHSFRGRGIGRSILIHLENVARQCGCTRVRLDTNLTLHEARKLYQSAGYRTIPAYNDNRYAKEWYEKSLVAGSSCNLENPSLEET
jgi:GNAT superfamily N-acetyltransferase